MSLNKNWLIFLLSNGFAVSDDSPAHLKKRSTNNATYLYDLSELGALFCDGEDANTFLQGQLSNDISLLSDKHPHQLSSYCTPKGRMLALFHVLKLEQGFALIAPHAVLDKVKSRLQMFVMRSKVTFTEEKDAVLLGISTTNDTDKLIALCQQYNAKSYPNTTLSITEEKQTARRFILTNTEAASKLWPLLSKQCGLGDSYSWRALDINSGLPQLYAPLIEALIPQSLNLDLVNGVNFKKGCYPGQEIIARVKYRGKPKTRMVSAELSAEHAVQIGQSVFIDGKAQSAGQVVNLVPGVHTASGNHLLQITLPINALSTGNVYLGEADGPALVRRPLAYLIAIT